MSADPEVRRRPATDVNDEEQEVDFGRYWRALKARWWLMLVGLVIGAAIGFAISTSGSRPYKATAVIYFGQPYAPGLGEIQNLGLQVAVASELVATKRERTAVADRLGIKPSRLTNAVTIEPVTVFKRRGGGSATRLAEVTVEKLPRGVALRAANLYSRRLVTYFSSYADVKLMQYHQRVKRIAKELVEVQAKIDRTEKRQAEIINTRGLPPAEKFLLLANLNSVLNVSESRQNSLESQQISLEDNVALANEIEKASIIEPAVAERDAAPSRRTGGAVGAFIGLIIGAIVALLWDPVERRFHKTAAQQPA